MVGFGVWLFGIRSLVVCFFSPISAKKNIESLCPSPILLTTAKQTSGDVRAGKSKILDIIPTPGECPTLGVLTSSR